MGHWPASPSQRNATLGFILLAFGISWLLFALGRLLLGPPPTLAWTAVAAVFMLGPGMAVLILRRPRHLSWADLGVTWSGIRWKWMALALLFALAVPLGTLLFNWLLGNVLHIAGFGRTAITMEMARERILAMAGPEAGAAAKQLDGLRMGAIGLLLLTLLAGAVAGCTVNFAFAMGEELGWRGLLFRSTAALGPWRQSLVIGPVWGLWHAPLILQGHNYPDHPVAGVLMMCLFTTVLSLPLAWFRTHSRCVWAAGVCHGTVNAVAGVVALFSSYGNSLLGGAAGLSAVLAVAMLGGMLVLFHPHPRATAVTA